MRWVSVKLGKVKWQGQMARDIDRGIEDGANSMVLKNITKY